MALKRLPLPALAAATGVAAFFGFRLFFFFTDDAFIAFRYVSNHVLGHGFVWNPPPFLPVEGYSSLLWIVLLRVLWGLSGLEPPIVANYASLAFGYATLFLLWRMVGRIALGRLERYRFALLALVLLGTVSNRTFLAWLSSGLETSLFNFCLTLWVYHALALPEGRGRRWIGQISLAAMLTALTRPDGLLVVAATLVLLVDWLRTVGPRRAGELRWALPLLVPALHLLWRRWFYGAWLPNTYYAKYTAPWPESGWRYAASFALEYALWIWLLVALVWAIRRGRMSRPAWVAVGTLAAHLGYYTLVIGGDHFEYRVYSYMIPLLFVSFVWLLARLDLRPRTAVGLLALFIACSWPVPWAHYLETRDLRSREETFKMTRPVAGRFPAVSRAYARAFDSLQAWLIDRSVCMRHQEHKIYYEFVGSRLPSREVGARQTWDSRSIMAAPNVGVVGWVFPHVALIDLLGLNDYVIARSEPPAWDIRRMAHERRPPPGYVECFQPDLLLAINFPDPPVVQRLAGRSGGASVDQAILACEREFRDRVARSRRGVLPASSR